MSNHPIAGFGFLAIMLGGIGFLSMKGVEGSRTWQAERHAEEERAKKEEEERAAQEANRARAEAIQGQIRAAVMAAERDELPLAIEMLKKAADQWPDSTGLWLNLGIAQRGAEQWDEAEKSFNRVLVLDAKDWDAVAELGTIRVVKQDLDGAFGFFDKIPVGEGRMTERLAYDPTFAQLDADPRFVALLGRHSALELRQEAKARMAEEAAAPPPKHP